MPDARITRMTPFATGSQEAAWLDRNCHRCVLWTNTPLTPFACAIDEALLLASWGDGTVDATIARRMGFPGATGTPPWPCPERLEKEGPPGD